MKNKEDPLQVKAKGGNRFNEKLFNDYAMNSFITLPKDHPDGEAPQTISGSERDYRYFEKALDIMAAERQVLILVDTGIFSNESDSNRLTSKLPQASWIMHNEYKQDNAGASAWVKAHLNNQQQQQTGMKNKHATECENSNENKKYLIADWFASAGFEFPAVIFVTTELNTDMNAYFCQRTKAKLVIYHAQPSGLYGQS